MNKLMKFIKVKHDLKIQWSFFVLCLFAVTAINAQEIKDDTIYVNSISTTTIQFPSAIDSFSTIPVYSGYNLKKDKNNISIEASKHNATNAVVAIVEGGREHRFLLSWNNGAISSKMNYDYSTMDKLKDHLWDLKLLKIKNSLPAVKQTFPKTENDIKYDSLVAGADKALNKKLLDVALEAYTEALNLKPTEYYPNAQIRFIRDEKSYLQRQKEQEIVLQMDSKEVEYRKIIAMADVAIKEKKYEVARQAYTQALLIHPENSYALQRLKIATYQLELETSVRDSSTFMPPTEELRKIMHSKFIWQKEPLPYTIPELNKKYPNIVFNQAPATQKFNTTSVLSKDHSRIMNELIMTNPKIAFSSTSQNIHLINTDITFYDSLVYLKFILQNDSKSDFLAGSMVLTWQRQNKQPIKLYPIYLYPVKFPIVKPGNQAVIIYVCKPYVVSNNDYFTFNMTDRLESIHLQVKIPGSGWNNSDYNKYFIKTVDDRREILLNEPD